jgi:hypothetical protein
MTDNVPAFTVTQADGTHSRIDLSAAGNMGDFAFRVTVREPGRGGYFFVYHTGEASIFVDILICMASNRPTADVIADVELIRRDLATRTIGRGYTTTSENTVDHALTRLNTRASDTTVGRREYPADQSASATLTLTHDADGLTFTLHRNHDDEPDRAVTIPTDQLCQFAAGMMWRSYSRAGRTHPDLSRLCSREYDRALDAFENSLRT